MLGKKISVGGDDFLKAADDAFDLLDMDGNGTIERGDIEYEDDILNLFQFNYFSLVESC